MFNRIALSWLFMLSLAPLAQAATISVNSNADSGAGSMRSAISGASNGDTVTIGLLPGPITLASEIAIPVSLTIQGPGVAQTISGTNQCRIFSFAVSGGTLSISGLTLAIAKIDSNAVNGGGGGGVYCSGINALTITNCAFSNNTAVTGAGIYMNAGKRHIYFWNKASDC